ncbi:MAG: GTPase HflX [Candidatus Omnitrophica bacterium]|nr:GTPase HflX [Candidatus Omnitrophota bacterium]
MYETKQQEKALLIITHTVKERWSKDALAQELKTLVLSAGLLVEDAVLVNLKAIASALYIGKGKAEEIAQIVEEKKANVVIFNSELSARQQRNLEDVLLVKTIDRTQLILDIFAAHAHTQEGMLQVELAQLEYLLPRLKGKGIELSRLGGGIGTRGPGEKKLEIDRRRITERIERLTREIEGIKQYRDVIRKKRQKEKTSVCSLVGYTSAGKSTLFNALTEGQEKTASTLFTTLDTVSRTFSVRGNQRAMLTDTVGFIYKLPLKLVEAFKATLEELYYADILLHVIDAASPDITRLRESVDSVLKDLKLSEKPVLLIFNKIDVVDQDRLRQLREEYPHALFISALKKTNLETVQEAIGAILFKDTVEVILKIPFTLMDVIDYIHTNCEVLKKTYQENEAVYWVRANHNALIYLKARGITVSEI